MALKLDVPTLAQEKTWCCWHTSAMMIWMYWQLLNGRAGPMNTMQPVYNADKGLPIGVQPFITLAKTVGMEELPSRNIYGNDDLFKLLKDKGPLWCAGWWYGQGHVIVLTGIDNGTVFLNDPAGGERKTGTLGWFNERLLKGLDGALMAGVYGRLSPSELKERRRTHPNAY